MNSQVFSKYLFFLIVGFGVLGLLVLAGYGLIPYQWLKTFFDMLAGDGDAAGFTADFHAAIAKRLLWTSAALAVMEFAILMARDCVQGFLTRLPGDARAFIQAVQQSARFTFYQAPRPYLIALLAVMLAGIWLRLWFIGSPLAHDEGSTFLDLASMSLVDGLSYGPSGRYHPIATIAINISTRMFGSEEWAIRLPMFIAGILLVPLSFWGGRILLGRGAGIISAAFVAIGWPLVAYSVNGRGYVFGNFPFLIMLSLIPFLVRTGNGFAWFVFILTAAISNFSVQSMLIGFFAAMFFFILRSITDNGPHAVGQTLVSAVVASFGAGAATLFLYSPYWVANGFAKLTTDTFALAGDTAESSYSLLSTIANTVWRQAIIDIPLPFLFILVVGFVFAVVFNRQSRLLIGSVVLGLSPFLFLVGGMSPPARIFQFILPLAAMVSGAGISDISHRLKGGNKASWLISAGAVILVLWTSANAVKSNAVEEHLAGRITVLPDITEALSSLLKPGDIVLGQKVSGAFPYYLKEALAGKDRKFEMVPKVAYSSPGNALRICSFNAPCPQKIADVYLMAYRPLEDALDIFYDYGLEVPRHKEAQPVLQRGIFNIYRFPLGSPLN